MESDEWWLGKGGGVMEVVKGWRWLILWYWLEEMTCIGLTILSDLYSIFEVVYLDIKVILKEHI